jgi:hypothetical protein
MNSEDDSKSFNWGPLGKSWWVSNGEACRASEKQILYACARHQGAQQYKAAALAGYAGDGDALRSAGSNAEGRRAVQDLLTLAQAAESGADESIATSEEIDKKLTRLIRAPDPAIALKASEVFDRREERKRQQNRQDKEALGDPFETAGELLTTLGLLAAPIAAGTYATLGGVVTATPHFRLMAPFLKQRFPELWESWRQPLLERFEADDRDRNLAEFDAAGNAPLLTDAEFKAAIAASAAPKRRGNGHAEFTEAPHACEA